MPFCKMCFDSNRLGFDDHNVKDASGNITCIYLRDMKCYTCGLLGHTPKYCKSNSAKKVNLAKKVKKAVENSGVGAEVGSSLEINNIFNKFAALCDEQDLHTDDECEEDLPLKDEIVWGKGFKSMMGKSWVELCC